MAKHRWAVTGTPIHNAIEELYPYFKFLRVSQMPPLDEHCLYIQIPFTSSYKVFRQNYCQEKNEVCKQRLHTYLDSIMIRRTHEDELMGTAIFKLPENHQETITLEFNKVERMIYDTLKRRYRDAINAAVKERTLEERSRLVLLMFLRLRQLTSHLFMCQATMERLFE